MAAEVSREQALTELEEVRSRLEEAEETLRAIRQGEVDALVITENRGEKVYTLKSADRPYRLMIEGMRQGAVTLSSDGVILYCNRRLAGMLGTPIDRVIGARLASFVDPGNLDLYEALLRQNGSGQGEIALRAADGSPVPVYVALSSLSLDEGQEDVLCAVVTDMTEQKRDDQLVADEKLARSILEHAADAVVVCDGAGRISRANPEALQLSGRNVLLERFEEAFPLDFRTDEPMTPAAFLAQPLAGHTLKGIEAELAGPEGRRLDLMLSAGPLRGAGGEVEGCVVTFTDITDRRQAERDLEMAWAAAEATNAAKDRFLATLSHELRTPLTPVLAVISGLEQDGRCPPEIHRDLEVIRRNVELEARLIDDLLDLTRIARGKLELRRQEVDVCKVLEHAIRTCCGDQEARGRLRLEQDFAAGDCHLVADGPRLTQVFWNLLNNAVKFTPAGGTIAVRTWREESPERLAVEVSDTGIGIPPEALPRIFDAFEQGEPGTNRRFGGLGLGLAISRAIVDQHGGQVAVHSDGPDRGTTFTVRLPIGTAAEPSSAGSRAASGEPAGVAALDILLVEDHADTAEAIATLLRLRGHRVTVAENLAAARDAAANARRIDLLISDLGLPDGSGHDLMRELAARHGLRGIALSGYGMDVDIGKSREAGFELHLTKPVNLQSLEAAIRQAAGAPAG
jgi:two-component system, chemotaxis family, CheB/CheR fusion protein